MQETVPVPGFWKRLFAFAIDGLLLGLAGSLLGLALFDVFARMGEWARLVGFVVALPYFAVLGSRIGGGQTIGKRLLGMRVVAADGRLLSVGRALARAAILATPFLLNGLAVPPDANVASMAALSIVVLGGMATIAYLYLFNRRTRQSLHDLVVGSRVVPAKNGQAAGAGRAIWKGHLWVAGILLLATGALPVAIRLLVPGTFLADMLPAYDAVAALPTVRSAGITAGATFGTADPRQDWVAVSVRRDIPRVDDPAFARRVADLVLEEYPAAKRRDAMLVELSYGYDLGIASGWRRYRYNYSGLESMAAGRR